MKAMSANANANELRIVGLSRSGNHPIINWIRRQARGRVCFLNCAEPKTNPFITCRPLASGRRAIANYRPFHLRRERDGQLSPKDWLIYSYEDCFLTMVDSEEFEQHHDQYVGTSARRLDVLILRDPFNLFASRIQAGFGGVTAKTTVRIWKQHARQFLGQRKYLSQPVVPLSYNRWSSCREYRREIAAKLGLQFSDRGFRHVSATGGGSSFDGRRFHGRAGDMPVLQRWRHLRSDPQYRDMFDDQTVQLARAAFDLGPEIEPFAQEIQDTAAV